MGERDQELTGLIRLSSTLAAADVWDTEAMRANRRITELFPSSTAAWWRLGVCLKKARDFSGARDAFDRSAETAKSEADRRAALRKVAQLDAYLAAVQVDSSYAATHHAIRAREVGQLDAALVWHWRAAALASSPRERSQALSSWAATLRVDHRSDEAVARAREARTEAPDPQSVAVASTVLSAALADVGRPGQAVTVVDELLREEPENSYVVNAAIRILRDLYKRTGNSGYAARAATLAKGKRDD